MLKYMFKVNTFDELAVELSKLCYVDCIVVNIAGGVAVGKTTFANSLASKLNALGVSAVVCSTDNFLYPNSALAQANLLPKKGWPETHDWVELLDFVQACKYRHKRHYSLPYYCHKAYDRIIDRYFHIPQPDVLLLEGVVALNDMLLSSMDFGIFLSVPLEIAQVWFANRCIDMIRASIGKPESFYHKWSCWDADQVMPLIEECWETINLRNFIENIKLTEKNADLIVGKDIMHNIVSFNHKDT